MDELRSKGLKALAWDFFGKLARYGTTFIVTIILSRLLEPSDFGLIAMVMVIVILALVFTDVGLGAALVQRRRLLPVHYSSVFFFNIFIGGSLTLLTYLSVDWISGFYNNKELIPILKVTALLFVINSFSSVQMSKLSRELNYKALAKSDIGAAVLSGLTGIGLAFYGAGVWSLVAQVVSRGVYYNIFIWSVSKWVPSLLFSFKALRQLWGFGFRMFLSTLLEIIYRRLDIIIIGKLFTPAILGFFDQAKRLDLMITYLSSGSIMAVMFPVLSKVQNDLIRFQNIILKILGIIVFITFFLLGVMYVISDEFIVLLYGEKWIPTIAYFKILVLSGFSYPISALLVNILSSRGNSKAFLKLEIYKKIFQSINFYIGFLWGIEGYLYGWLIVNIIEVALNILFASRETKLDYLIFAKPILLQMLITVSIAYIVIIVTDQIETYAILLLLIKGIMYTIMYFVINMLLKTTPYEYFKNEAFSILQRWSKRNNDI